jgi:hypothetical protein
MKENGKMIIDLEGDSSYSKMVIDMKDIMSMVRRRAREVIFGQMEKFMMANG